MRKKILTIIPADFNQKQHQDDDLNLLDFKDFPARYVTSWVNENFPIAINQETFHLPTGPCIYYTEEDVLRVKKFFRKNKVVNELSRIDQLCFLHAFASTMINLREQLKTLDDMKKTPKGKELFKQPFSSQKIWNEKLQKWDDPDPDITIYAGPISKKKPRTKNGKFTDSAETLHKQLNYYNGKKSGIPQFVRDTAKNLDHYLKELMPEIKTHPIIIFVLNEIGLNEYAKPEWIWKYLN